MKWMMKPSRVIRIQLIGAGGTGSMIATRLAKLAVALRKLDDGAPKLDVTIFDPDTVSDANIGRQAFFAPDIGMNKATVLVNRINLCEGLDWIAVPHYWREITDFGTYDNPDVMNMVITAVDTREARQQVYRWFSKTGKAIWLDCGNNDTTGQVVFGARVGRKTELPCVADLFPEVIDADRDATDDAPSCSLAEALLRQDLMINPTIANTAVTLLWRAIRFGGLDHHGAFHDVVQMLSSPMSINPAFWKAMGWNHEKGKRFPVRKPRVRAKPAPVDPAQALESVQA